MKKSLGKKIAKITLIVLGVILLLLLIVPFLIPVKSPEGLASAAQLASPDSKFITIPFEGTDGIDIHYFEGNKNSNNEETVFILLHGSLFNSYTWSEVINFFDSKGRVYAYDQIPYGLSEKLLPGDWEETNPYTQDAAIEQLFSFMDTMKLQKAVLVGNSYGSTLAVKAALTNPDRIVGLILGDAAVYLGGEMPSWIVQIPQIKHLGPLFARGLGSGDSFFNQTYLDPSKLSKEKLDLIKINTKITNWDFALWEYLSAWGSASNDFISNINKINQPVLVVSGDSDNIVPIEDSRKLDTELPNSTLEIIENSGHVPQEETPELFIKAIEPWLDLNF